MDKNGQMIMVNLLILVMTILVMIAVIPVLNSVLSVGKQSDILNCPGYDHANSGTIGDHALDYNASLLNTDTVACLAIGLYVPYIVLTILIAGVAKMLSGRLTPQEPDYGY